MKPDRWKSFCHLEPLDRGKAAMRFSLLTLANCNGPSAAAQISGIEVDVINNVLGTDVKTPVSRLLISPHSPPHPR